MSVIITHTESDGEIVEYNIKIEEELCVTQYRKFVEELEELIEKYRI